MDRFNWDEAAMLAAFPFALRSSCLKHKVAAIVMSPGHQLLGEGYNGSASGMRHCLTEGCAKQTDQGNGQVGDCVGLHAEENAITHSHPRLMEGGTIYITLQPCVKCAVRIVQHKLRRVVAAGKYLRVGTEKDNHSDETFQAERILRQGGVLFEWFEPEHAEVAELIERYQQFIDQAITATLQPAP